MPQIDGILRIVVQQGGGLLRMVAGQKPTVLRGNSPLKVFLPTTPEDMIVELLGELWTEDRVAALDAKQPVAFGYDHRGLGHFQARLWRDAGGVLHSEWTRALLAPPPDGADEGSPAPESEPDDHAHSAAEPNAGAYAESGGPNDAPAYAEPAPGAPAAAAAPSVVALAPGALAPAALPPVRSPYGEGLVMLVPILEKVVELGCSDLHLSDGEPAVVRIDGALRRLEEEPREVAAAYLQVLVGAQGTRARLERGQSVDYSIDLPQVGRFRVNVYRHDLGFAAAIRVLKRQAPALSSLRLPARLDDIAAMPHGLVLVTGPTGSGKSTTLAALARSYLRRRGGLMVSLEDPIEYVVVPDGPKSLVRQREVGRHAVSFASGLRDALREDPDLLLIGEMRDADTISLALTAAETGHLVLASMHSRSAGSAIERIVDTYPPERQRQIRVQMADALRIVVAQRLVPKAGGGRLPALELLRINHNVAALIRDGKTAQIPTALQSGHAEGMLPLERCLAQLVNEGQVDKDAARAAANDLSALNHYLQMG